VFCPSGNECSDHDIKVILVSNVAFEFSDQSICAKDLAPKFQGKIAAQLTKEIPSFSTAQLDNLHFFVTGVSIGAMHSFLHGEAMALFKARFGEDHSLNVYSWVRLLQSEIVRKNDLPSDEIKTVDELISKKCIAAQFVDDSLALVRSQRKTPPDMNLVSTELKAAGWSAVDIMRLSKKMPQAAADHTDSTNLEAMKIVERLVSIFHSNAIGLPAFVALAEQELLADLPVPYNDRAYLWALSVMVFHEEI
jgi:hypothetical protein